MPTWLLGIDIVAGPFPYVVWGLTAAAALALLIRRPTLGWVLTAAVGVLGGAVLGVGAVLVADVPDAFGEFLPQAVAWWAGAAFALVGLAVVSLWRSRAWRKVVAIVLVLLALASAALGINAAFGINRTLGSLFGLSSVEAATDLGGPDPSPSATGPAYLGWTPPADMPTQGRVLELAGDNAIPSSAGYSSRNATIYLPPAYGLEGAPALPLVVMMMGKPGNPDPTPFVPALDQMAAKNHGLAPVVIVVDQLAGDQSPSVDPSCADSKAYGGLSTYVNKDVVEYAKAKLRVSADPKLWTIGGYSNGGACAFAYAAAHPDVWGNLIDISGDEYPGIDDPQTTVSQIYGGDQAAYDAAKPAALLTQNAGRYAGHVAVFTAGALDANWSAQSQRNEALAQQAGFTASFTSVAGADHVGDAVPGGMLAALTVLYPVLGLSAP